MLPAPSPQERLGQTRQELRELFANDSDTRLHGGFPRSATMRFLLGGPGTAVAGAVASAVAIGMLPRTGKLLRFIPLTTVARLLFQRKPVSVRSKP
jgi:hypothetical protein